jgi:glyoxylase-like metal-dependent hydrolase (beta-lactamase superfamily II)
MRISERCYAITGLGYSAPWSVNSGFIAGDALTLVIDTGGNTAAAGTIHGYASAVRPPNRLRVINTEGHFDHIGGNGFFRELGIDVWGHPGVERTAAEFEAEIAEFNAAIPDPVRRGRLEALAFFHATQLSNPNRRLDRDGTFDLGGCAAQILLTPGHTPANLSVWFAEEGVLYTGDCVVCRYLPNLNSGTPADWRVWLESLDRLRALEPAAIVPGHGPVVRGGEVRGAIDALRKVLEEAIARAC